MASLWESKIGRTLPRTYITEKDFLTMAKGQENLFLDPMSTIET